MAFLVSVLFTFFSCANDGGGGTPEVTPGTIGSADPALLATAKLAQQVDPDNSNVILFYYRPDGKYTDWGLWLWPKGGEGEPGYKATSGKAEYETLLKLNDNDYRRTVLQIEYEKGLANVTNKTE